MPKRRALADDETRFRPSHHQHCLFLISEAERMIDRAAGEWSQAELSSVKSRLARITEKLMRASGPAR